MIWVHANWKKSMKTHFAVFTALSMRAHGVSFESARGGVAARVHAFLKRGRENKTVGNMWTWSQPLRSLDGRSLSDWDFQVRGADFLSRDSCSDLPEPLSRDIKGSSYVLDLATLKIFVKRSVFNAMTQKKWHLVEAEEHEIEIRCSTEKGCVKYQGSESKNRSGIWSL